MHGWTQSRRGPLPAVVSMTLTIQLHSARPCLFYFVDKTPNGPLNGSRYCPGLLETEALQAGEKTGSMSLRQDSI